MNRETAEKIIGDALELIGLVCESLDPEYDGCSMCVSPRSKSAVILKEVESGESEYTLNYYKAEDFDDECVAN